MGDVYTLQYRLRRKKRKEKNCIHISNIDFVITWKWVRNLSPLGVFNDCAKILKDFMDKDAKNRK